jgi:hypothetical protein
MGENDVKFTRFADIYGHSIIHSVDGDFLPVSLMHFEKNVVALGKDKDPPRIAVFRLEFNMKTKAAPVSKLAGAKRTANGTVVVKGEKYI